MDPQGIRPAGASLSRDEHAKLLLILDCFETKSADEILGLYSRTEQIVDGPRPSDILDTLTNIKEITVAISAYFRPSDFDVTEELKTRIQRTLVAAERIGLFTGENFNGAVTDFRILFENLLIINNTFVILRKFVKNFKKFTHTPLTAHFDQAAEAALIEYISVGEKIRRDPNFSVSPVKGLENLILDASLTVPNLITQASKRPDNLVYNRTFIALVAPSLCGKSQSAFAMNEARPLYFVLSHISRINDANRQDVYFNFNSLVLCLQQCATKDLETLGIRLDTDRLTILDLISSGNLKGNHSDKRFYVLGFLIALMEEAEDNYNPEAPSELLPGTRMSWMEFHARRTHPRDAFYFESLTIAQAEAKVPHLKHYFLFLDEFVGDPWTVLIRNLFRSIGLRSVVANTNSDIVNLTGRKHASASRGQNRDEVWSLIVPRLNAPTFDHVEPFQITLEDERERDSLDLLLDNLRNVQLPALRPGIAYMVLGVLDQLAGENAPFTVCKVLDRICNDVGQAIRKRKRRIYRILEGRLANLALSLSNSYWNENINTNDPYLHQSSFLLDHLYYLLNPVDNADWVFMTFHPEEEEGNLYIFKDGKEEAWNAELTYFDKNELVTILACMSILPQRSIYADLKLGQMKSIAGNSDVGAFTNPLAFQLDGNRLEVLSSVSVIDSSHHDLKRDKITFAGQLGSIFAFNMIFNMIERDSDRGRMVILPPTPSTKFFATLESFKVPFLYAANMDVPQLLQDLTALGSINVGYCKRTANEDKIDFKFELILEPMGRAPEISFDGKFWGAVECKYWQDPVPTTALKEIMIKAANTEYTFFNVIVCKSIFDNTSNGWTSLHNFGEKNGYNIYKLIKYKYREATRIKWHPLSETTDAPILVVLIYELDVINRSV